MIIFFHWHNVKRPGPSCLLSLLRGQLLSVLRLYHQIHWYFCCKYERSFCNAKASHIFSTKNIGVFLTNNVISFEQPGPDRTVIKLFPCSIHLSMKFYLPVNSKLLICQLFSGVKFSVLMNMKIPTLIGIFSYLSSEKISCSAEFIR